MPLAPGARLGPYGVIARIGAGGMGEVYRARDMKLNRDVALKVLPDSFASDLDRLARFTREAQTLASLNHPNIAAIYGLEEGPGEAGHYVRALVMELVEGEDLSQRIARGAIPVDEALPIAKQIAEALEAAHEHGIIHRDLKPANIKVRPDGTVKVLDFGLAKATGPAEAGHYVHGGAGADRSVRLQPDLSQSPTITSPAVMTGVGVILGTAAYMSPEQARGKPVDKRADIWAFGCVLYEMVTGRRAFDGDDVSETLARVLEREPDWANLPAKMSPMLRVYLERCLQKDPRQRVRDIGDVRLALDGAFDTRAPQTTSSATFSAPRGRLVWMATFAVAAALAVALGILTLGYLRETVPPETRSDIVTPATDQPVSFALSPDGQQIAFVASGEGRPRLWLRSLATTTAQPLAGTEGATFPFWSPDSRSIGFFAGGALKRLDLGGGAPRSLAPASSGRGGTWNADGVIVFAPDFDTALMRVSAAGGAAVPATTFEPQHRNHRLPWFLPDGRRFLFYVLDAANMSGIYLAALDGRAPTRLTPADSAGQYLPSGWLLWVRTGTLVAQRLDVAQAALTGEPLALAEGVAIDTFNQSAVSVAATGLVAYRTGAGSQRQLTWVDRSGTARGTVGDPNSDNLNTPHVSPDGRRVVVARTVQGNQDLWLLDGDRTSRLTFDAAFDAFPVWSPDGARIVFRREGRGDLYQMLTNGSGSEEPLATSDERKTPSSWSSDGRFVLYSSGDAQNTNTDLWVVPMTGDRTPFVFLKTPFRESRGVFSPDGRWVAYTSNESGPQEVYVRPFVPPGAAGTAAGATGARWQVSTAGGVSPVWRYDGQELFYLSPAGAMMAAPIMATETTFEPGAPVELFPTRIYDVLGGGQYHVTRDGRFLINRVLDDATAPITLLQHWNPELKK